MHLICLIIHSTVVLITSSILSLTLISFTLIFALLSYMQEQRVYYKIASAEIQFLNQMLVIQLNMKLKDFTKILSRNLFSNSNLEESLIFKQFCK